MDRTRHSALVVLVAMMAAGCGDSSTQPDIDDPFGGVASVTASVDSILIPAVGFTRSISATVRDSAGATMSGVSLTWGSRDPTIAGAVAPGRIDGRGYGDVAVIVAAGAVADTVIVTVGQVPETIEIEQAIDTLEAIGHSSRLLVYAWDSAGAAIDPLDGAWTSADETIATINRFGTIRFEQAGTVEFQWSHLGESASASMTVRQTPDFMWVYGGESGLAVGDTTTVLGSVRDPDNDEIVGAPVAWTSSDEDVATVSQSGLVTAVGGGNVVIAGESSGLVGQRSLSVAHAAPPLGTLSVLPGVLEADAAGQTFVLAAHVDDGGGATVAVPATWTSRNRDIATVDGSVARAVTNGQTWLVAEYDGRTDSVSISVDRIPAGITFQGVPTEVVVTYTGGVSVYPAAVDRLGGVIGGATTWTMRDTTVAVALGSSFGARGKGQTWAIAEVMGFTDSLHVTVLPRYDADYAIKTLQDLALFESMAIEELGGTLSIYETVLTNIDGLESLTSIRGALTVKLNDGLSNMDGLANLETVTGDILIEKNAVLTNPTLPSLAHAGSLAVFDNFGVDQATVFPVLETLDGGLRYMETGTETEFPVLTSVGSLQVVFHGPEELRFPALEVVTGDFALIDVPEIFVLSAPRLWRVRSMTIRGNDHLTTLTLTGLNTIQRDFEVTTNPRLTDLSSLSVSSGMRTILISQNEVLSSVSGLMGMGDALGSDPVLTDDLHIENNPSLSTDAVEAMLDFINEKFVGTAFLGVTATGGNG